MGSSLFFYLVKGWFVRGFCGVSALGWKARTLGITSSFVIGFSALSPSYSPCLESSDEAHTDGVEKERGGGVEYVELSDYVNEALFRRVFPSHRPGGGTTNSPGRSAPSQRRQAHLMTAYVTILRSQSPFILTSIEASPV